MDFVRGYLSRVWVLKTIKRQTNIYKNCKQIQVYTYGTILIVLTLKFFHTTGFPLGNPEPCVDLQHQGCL